MSRRLVPFLQNAYPGTSKVVLLGMEFASDREVLQRAKEAVNKAFILFEDMFEDNYPKAVSNLRQGREELKAFYDFPAQHWQSIRTTNPIESTFATIRHHTKLAKGCLTDKSILHMMFKLADCAQKNWRRLRGFDLLAKVESRLTACRALDLTKTRFEP